MFLKVILCFHALSFCSKCVFVLFFKNLFRGFFARRSQISNSYEKEVKAKIGKHKFHIEIFATVSRLFRN